MDIIFILREWLPIRPIVEATEEALTPGSSSPATRFGL
jgi:hypothetical protein